MKFRIDLHVHTRYSGDNIAEPEEVVQAALEQGLQGLAFTEHYSYGASEYAERLAERFSGKLVILRGVEFSAAEGHCLVFGVNTDGLAMKHAPVRELIRVVNKLGGAVIPSHPYRGTNSMDDLVLNLSGLTALEGCNGVNLHPMNVRAITSAGKLRLPFTGGSDAHEARDVGTCYTEFDDTVNSENFLSQLKAGRYRGVDVRKISKMGFFKA